MADKFNLDGFSVDEDNACTADGGFVGDLTGNVTGKESTYTSSGAISIDDRIAILDGTNSTCIMTIADGLIIGNSIFITCPDSTSAVIVTLTTAVAPAANVVTFTVGDSAIITWTSQGWGVVQGVSIS